MKVRLDVLLIEKGLTSSRQKAQSEILAGNVIVNGQKITKSGFPVDPQAVIELKKKFPYVSRGALKLIHALDYFKQDVTGKITVDIGSSTGGFTQVLLERGAVKVYAVDCGTNQLDWKLRSDPRVVSLENTNARYINQLFFDPKPQGAVIDVSFISLTNILGSLQEILDKDYFIIALIKPQFELEKEKIGNKGLVPEKYRREAVEKVLSFADSIGLQAGKVIESPITGAKSGNVEYLVIFTDKN